MKRAALLLVVVCAACASSRHVANSAYAEPIEGSTPAALKLEIQEGPLFDGGPVRRSY